MIGLDLGLVILTGLDPIGLDLDLVGLDLKLNMIDLNLNTIKVVNTIQS